MSDSTEFARTNSLSVALIVPDTNRRLALVSAIAGSHSGAVVEFGNYPAQDGPNEIARLGCDVVIVDLDRDLERALSTIGDICGRSPAVTVMACSNRNDSNLLRRSMQAGAREFLVDPFLPETVAEAFARALARRPAREMTLGKMFVFVPTKGGVGVTTLAANFAIALNAESGARVAVVDMDFQFGEIALALGIRGDFSVIDALRNPDRLDPDFLSALLIRHRSGLAVLASPEEYISFHSSAQGGASKLLRILREQFDYVVVDSGACHGHLQEALFEATDKLYLVTELSLPALRNAHRLIAYLATSDWSRRLEIVVNRFNSRHGDIDEDSAAKAMGRRVNWKIPNAYAAARAAQDSGVPMALQNTPVTKALVQMARAACGKPEGGEKKPGGGFSFFSKGLTEAVEI